MEDTLKIPDTPEHTLAPLPTDSDWEEERAAAVRRRLSPTPLDFTWIDPKFASVRVGANLPAGWIMPEELKRDWHINHAMPEFFIANGTSDILAVGSRVNPIKI
jgi:hypothetical protein